MSIQSPYVNVAGRVKRARLSDPEATVVRVMENPRRWASVAADDWLLRDLCALKEGVELVAYFRALKRLVETRPVGSRLDLATYVETLVNLPREALLPVLTSPQGTHWRSRCTSLLARGSPKALERLIQELAPFVVSASMLAGESCKSISACLPRRVTLPGLGLSIVRSRAGPLTLSVKAGRLFVQEAERKASWPDGADDPSGELKVQELPSIPGLNARFDAVDPELRRLFPWNDAGGKVDARAWLGSLEENALLIEQVHPRMHEELRRTLRIVIPTSRRVLPRFSYSSSCETAWGAISTSLTSRPWLASNIIHEHRHQLLSALLCVADVVTESESQPGTLYSPWRIDPRPQLGVYHGVFVFVSIAEFLARLTESNAFSEGGGVALKAAGVATARALIGIEELRSFGGLSAFGAELLNELAIAASYIHQILWRREAFSSGAVRGHLLEHHLDWQRRWQRPSYSDVHRSIERWT